MRYLGGKTRIAPYVSIALKSLWTDKHTDYYEPFVGSGAIAECMADKIDAPMLLSDLSLDLILMYMALKDGWMPPENITESEYQELRVSEPSPLRGFAGYGASYGGKFFGGYARGEGRNYAGETRKVLLKAMSKLGRADFIHCSYTDIQLTGKALIYCDPPYADTTEYGNAPKFDSNQFWTVVRDWREMGHTVVVSEYKSPDDFTSVWERERSTNIRPKNGNESRVERLFI